MSDHSRPRPLSLLVSSSTLLLALVLVACSGGGAASPAPSDGAPPSGSPSGQPSGEPSPSDAGGGEVIEHATGATDILLRYEEGGGFVMPQWTASMTPHFTLYGDGTAVFRDPFAEAPPAQGSAFVNAPLRIARLTEEQIQDVLRYALTEGGLAGAKPEYRNDMIADASTAFFTIDAAGIDKTVSVYALGLEPMDDPAMDPDGPARAAFAQLAQRLTTIDQGGSVASEVYVPEAYRVSLFESPGVQVPDLRSWPWDDVEVADFQPDADPNGFQFPQLVMTPEQVEALGVEDAEGGFQGVVVTGPDGMPYTVAVRPLLPDEGA